MAVQHPTSRPHPEVSRAAWLRKTSPFALVAALQACSTLLPSGTGVSTDAATMAADADAGVPGAGPDAVTDAKPLADVPAVLDTGGADATVHDAAAQDAATADAGPASCAALTAAIDELKPALQACTAAQGCAFFEYPICNSIGCFRFPVAQGKDVSQVEALAAAAGKQQCPGFHCGCGYKPDWPFCLGGQCRMCPPDCGGTCDELAAALAQAGKQLGSSCSTDADCTSLSTPFCEIGNLGCYQVAAAKTAPLEQWQALVKAWLAGACSKVACECAPPAKASCVKGMCVFVKTS